MVRANYVKFIVAERTTPSDPFNLIVTTVLLVFSKTSSLLVAGVMDANGKN